MQQRPPEIADRAKVETMPEENVDIAPTLSISLRTVVVCSPNSQFLDELVAGSRACGLQLRTCSEVPQLTLALTEAMPDCILLEGPADFLNRAVLYCEMLDMHEATVVVSTNEGHLSLDLPTKVNNPIGVIPKPQQIDHWIETLQRTAKVHALLRAAKQHLARHRRAMQKLSAAQLGVLDDVCNGKLNKRMAAEQGVSLRTIEQRRRRVFDVLGVPSAAPLGYEVGFAAAIELFVDALDDLKIL